MNYSTSIKPRLMNQSFSRTLFLLLFTFALSSSAFAAKRYWIVTATTSWKNKNNWSATSGGTGGATVPGSSDTAYFDSNGNGNCNIDSLVNVKRFEVQSTYTSTISQNANTITVGSGGMSMNGGTFTGGSSTITSAGVVIAGTAFTSTSGTLNSTGNFTISSGSFTHNNGKVSLNATLTLTVSNTGGSTFYDLTMAPTSTATITVTSTTSTTVSNTYTHGGTALLVLNGGTLNVTGNMTVTNNTGGGGGTALIKFNGTGTQTFTGTSTNGIGSLPSIEINKSSGTLNLASIITVLGNWTYTAGTVNAGTSTVIFSTTKTITGTHTLKKVIFSGSSSSTFTIASGTTLSVDSTLIIGGTTQALTFNTGTINANGDVSVINTNTSSSPGSATIVIHGTGSQSFSGQGTYGGGRLCNVEINKSSGTVTLSDTLTIIGNWTYTAGTVNAGSSFIIFGGTKTISGSHTLNHVTFSGTGAATYTIASGTTLTVAGTLYIPGTTASTFSTGTIAAQGDISANNSATTGGGGTATLLINGGSSQTFAGGSTWGAARLCNIQINKSGGTLTLSNIITALGSWTWSSGTVSPGSSTIIFSGTKTITGTHTLGNINFNGTGASTYTIASGTTLSATGTITIDGTSAVTLNTGTINAQGDVTVTNSSGSSGGSASINFNGTGTQTLTGSGTTGAGYLPNVTINKSSTDTLKLVSTISCNGDWTYTSGIVNPGTSSVVLTGTKNLDAQGTSTTMSFYKLATYSSGTRTLTGNADVDNDFTIASGTTMAASSYTMNVGGKWNDVGTFTSGTSTIVFDGSSYRTITKSGGAQESFYNLTMNRNFSGASISLGSPAKVTHTLAMTKGKMKTTRTNYLELADNVIVTGGHDSAYVHGVIRKTGNDTVWFPLGDTTLTSGAYHPLRMSAPSSTSDQFEAEYLAQNPNSLYSITSKEDTLESVSDCEYWMLERKVGSSNVLPTLSWNSSCPPGDASDLRVAAWDGSQWTDLRQATFTVNWPQGTITSALNPGFSPNPQPLTIAYSANKSSFATLKHSLDGGYYEADGNAFLFKFDDEYNDQNNSLTYRILNASNTNIASTLIPSTNNNPLSYYGDNRFKLNLLTTTGAIAAGYYILEVTNEKQETFYLRFHKS